MTIEQRVKAFEDLQQQIRNEKIPVTAPVSVFPTERFALLDGQLVELLGLQPDYPKMSPAYWVRARTSDGTVHTLPVSINDRGLETLSIADLLQARIAEGALTGSRK